MPRISTLASESPLPGDTRTQLINAAERLFAESGIEAVSLRSIGIAAQQANKVVVQYHFINKKSLVAAIFEMRAPEVERRIADLAHELIKPGEAPSLLTLVTVLFRPIIATDENGPDVYARFLLNLLCSGTYWSVSNVSLARLMFGLEPVGDSGTTAVVRMIDQALPGIPKAVLRQRICSLTRMLLGAVVNRENALAAGEPVWPLEALLADQLQMIAEALKQPVSPELASALTALDEPTRH
jgi:AcrR family transcriptional regulator